MKIENNILRHYLQNVYWIGGTACGGKTTASKTIAEKYGFYHYDADSKFNEYKELAEEENQPELSKNFKSALEYFSRPTDEYVEFLDKTNREAFEMMVIELILLSKDQTIVVEGHYPPELMKEIAPNNRIAFLYAEDGIIKRDYYDREDKQSMLKAISEVAKSDEVKNHVFDVILESAALQIKAGKECGYKILERDDNSTVESMLYKLEKHFELL